MSEKTTSTTDRVIGVLNENQTKPQVGISGLQDANKTPPPPPSNSGFKNGK